MQTLTSRISYIAAVLLLLAALPAEALRVTDVAITSRPTNGDTYRTNETIEVTVTFDKRVRGGRAWLAIGPTSINVVIGPNTRRFWYDSGDGTPQLVYSYTVQSSDRDTDGISVTSIVLDPAAYITSPLDLNAAERLPDSEYALPRNQIANAGPHKVNRSAATGIFYHAQQGNTERLYRHSGIDYRPATAIAFDGRNRPYMLSFAVYGNEPADNRFLITTLRNGEWTSFSFKDEFIAALGAPSSTLPVNDRYSEMVIDEHDDLYAVLTWVSVRPVGSSRDDTTFALLYAKNVANSSFNGDFQVLEMPGKLMLETRMSANDFANYPPLVGWTEGHSVSDPTYPYPQRVSWAFAAWHKFYVLPLRRDANGNVAGMTLADSIRVDNKLGYVTSHSGGQSFAVTRGDTSFIAYMRHEGETNTYGNNTVYARAFYRKNHQVGVGDTLSARKRLFLSHPDFADAHSTPVVAIDLDGYIHVLGGAHGGPFAYRKSSHPMDITSWDDVANVGSGRTYSSLVIDNLSQMFSTFRTPSPYKLFFQDGTTTTGFANNNGILFADQNCGHAYRVYYHSQHKDRPRPGTNERIYVNWTANCEANLDHWDGYRILAYTDDRGSTFQLPTKADFTSRVERLDTSPESFSFTERTGEQPDSSVTSDTITVRGINSVVPIEVTGGTLVVNGQDFTGTTVARGRQVAVKVIASSSYNTETTATVTIGGVSANFSVTTRAADTTPDAFTFMPKAFVDPGSSVTSDAITVSGIEAAAAIAVDGGSLVVDGSAFTGKTVSNGQTVAVEVTASSSYNTETTATVTIGGVSANFVVTTRNDAVTAEAGENQTVDEGDEVTLSGSGTHEAKPNEALTYSWSQTSSPTVTLSSTSVAAPTFTAPNLLATEDLTFELTVSVGRLNATDTVTITVNADNDAPTAKAGENQTVTQETAVTLSGSGTDPEGQPLKYSWSQTASSPTVSLAGETTKTPSFTAPKVSENTPLTFELTVSDGTLSATDTVTITVTPDKDAFTAEAGDNQPVDEGDEVALSGSGTHPEEKPLTYSWRQTSGTTVTLSSTSVAAPTFTAPNLLVTEDLTFELTVSDGILSATDTVTITVTGDNDAPTAEAGDNQPVDEGDAVTLSGSGTDPEGQTLTYSWRQTTSAPTVSLTGATTKTPSFTAPNVAENTPLTFELTVSDGILSTTDTVTITVTGDNDAPTANAGTNTTGTQETSVTLSGSGTDPEGQTLTYSWRQTAGSPTVSLTGATTKTPSFIAPKVAENTPLTFELTVSDGTLSATDTVTITVTPSTVTTDKDAPTAQAGTDKTVDEGDEVTLSGSGTHPEEQPLTYSWRQTSGTTVTLSSASVAAPTFTAPNLLATEDLTFELTVSAGRLSTTDTVTITVTADNDAPTADAGDNQPVDEGDTVTLSGSGTDPEKQSLTYTWRQTSSGATVALSSTSVAAPTFTAPNLLATEDLTFELTVSDGSLSATDTVTITVTADNDAPTADAGTNKTVDAGATVTLSGSGTDPEEQPLTYSWRQTSSGTTVALSSTSVAAPTFTAPALREAEDLTFELTVSDGTLSTIATVTITVNAADTTPDAFSFTEQTGVEPGADVTSDAITVSGIEAAAAIAVTGGSLVVDGSDFSGATVTNGQQVAVKVTASNAFSTATTAKVTIGGVSANFKVTTRAADTTPEAFAFTEQTEAEPGADVTSNAITVSGIEAAVSISVTGGSLVVDGSAFSGATVSNGQTVAIKVTASSLFSTATTAKVTIGGVSANFEVTTRAADTTPEAFTFKDQAEAEPGSSVTSDAITVSGIEAAVPISVDGGSLVVDGSTFSGATVSNGQTVAVKVTASSAFSTTTTATVTIGGVTANFKVTTRAADTTPDAFTFTDQTDIEPGTQVTSDAITVSGIEAAVSISVDGGSLVVDGSAFSGATVSNGQTVAVKVTASSAFSTATTAKVFIGGVSAHFKVTTRAADTTPEAFTFKDQAEAEPGSSVTSDAITVSGIEAAVSISVDGGSLVVDGSAFSGATVSNGQTVAVKVTASSAFSTATTAKVFIGGVSTHFKVTTRAADTTPEAFAFTEQTEAEPGASVTSNAIAVSGIEAAVPISVTGGSLVVDGSAFSGATVTNGQTVAVKATASSSFSTATTATVTIGGVSANFKVTTRAADTTPDAFSFTEQTEIEPGTQVTSNAITVSGINAAATISVTGGSLVVDGSTFSGATVTNGQTVAVKVTASSAFSTATTATVTIGGVSANFKVTTKEVEIEPPTTTATAGFLRVRLDWTPVASATGYDAQVQGKPFDGGTWPTAWTSVATDMAGRKVGARRRYMHTGLSPDSLYRYQVRSRIGAAVSAWSALTPDAAGIQPLVGAPTGFKAEAGAGQVTLLWTGPHHKSITKWRYRDATALGDATKGGWQDIEVSVNAGEYSAAVPDLTPGQAYRFQVRAVNGAGGGKPSAVSDEVVVAAVSKLTTQPIHRLAVQARPNPFNPRTTLQLALPTPETVSLSIYNLYGQRVRVLLNAESLPAGYATVAWDSRDDHGAPVASGLYLYRLSTTAEVVVGKMALIR